MERYFDSKIEKVKIRPEQWENTYNIERPGFAGLNSPQDLKIAQNEIAHPEILIPQGGPQKCQNDVS